VSGRDPRYAGRVIEQNNAAGTVVFWQSYANQSSSDEDGTSLGEYIHAMFGLLRQAKARDVLMIGCGGGTLATMLHRAGVSVTVVDIDPLSFEIARDYFHMPGEIERHVADGAEFLRKSRHRYDAIVLDAFAGDGIPKQLLTKKFFTRVRAAMKPRGALFLINIIVASDEDRTPDRIARAMKEIWSKVRLLDSDGWLDRNAVIAAGAVAKLKRPRLLMRPKRRAAGVAKALRELSFRRLRR
jgi:spermidine synthase